MALLICFSYIFKVRKVSLKYDFFNCFPHLDGKDEEMVSGTLLFVNKQVGFQFGCNKRWL